MRIKTAKDAEHFICHISGSEIAKGHIKKLLRLFQKNKDKKIGLNLEKIKKIHSSFFNILRENKISVFSLNNDILNYFCISGSINSVCVFLTQTDFLAQKRQLVKRDFKVL
jgi:arginine deiminase